MTTGWASGNLDAKTGGTVTPFGELGSQNGIAFEGPS
jgi:hypothetical protein